MEKTSNSAQKYPMTVSGPGKIDAEQELHESLLDKEDASSTDNDSEIQQIDSKDTKPKNQQKVHLYFFLWSEV